MRFFFLLISLFILLTPDYASAWGLNGHRIVARIAQDHLTKKAKRQIQQILGKNDLPMSANWADFIKSDSAYNYLGPWHYVNAPAGLNEKAFRDYLESAPEPNAYFQLGFLVEKLEDQRSLPAEERLLYLRLLVHILGDVHQPMHVGRAEDLGGNRITIKWFGQKTNLHRLWDEQLIDFQQLSYSEYAQSLDKVNKREYEMLTRGKLSDWLYESYQGAEQLYRYSEKDARLSYRYNYDQLELLNQQLLKGGLRLAKVLNQLFG